ncbi:hypothetical protein Avbf_05220 [Armadillidium vulgare]|nr:hypothetical protein Avbf_05220 [Armadillidium vulgare]
MVQQHLILRFPIASSKRQCIGEALARMEIFIFLVTMLQHVSFHPPPNKDINMDTINVLIVQNFQD